MSSPITVPALPYDDNALDPVISSRTISFHYGKHHQAYAKNLNGLIDGTDMADMSLEQIMQKAHDEKQGGVFNNAAQVWNHTFYWNSMKAKGGGKPTGKLADMIDASFGGFEAMKDAFGKAAKTQFGSGWGWLVQDGDALKVMGTANADTPLVHGLNPLLTIDVWEHAYYLDHQNLRPGYVDAILDKLINWDFASANLK